MTKIKTILSLIAVASFVAACTTTTLTSSVKLHENTTGGYLAPAGSPHYQTHGGTLYAYDGTRWYALRAAEVDAGEIRGMKVGTPERWIVAGGSHVTTYHRTPSTFRDQDLRPVFVQQ